MESPIGKIETHFDREWTKLAKKFNDIVKARTILICNSLRPRINITYITCGMGSYALSGDDFVAHYDDHSEGPHAIDGLFDAAKEHSREIYTIKDATTDDLILIRELDYLLDWWVDKTGGCDVDMSQHSTSSLSCWNLG